MSRTKPLALQPRVRSFPPVAARDARLLILGSMPGEASLAAGRYYAHPRNAFWPIMASVLGFDAAAPYPQKLAQLRRAGVALWDVLEACHRRGSLDSSIHPDTLEVHDFAAFFREHRRIRCVLFNGTTAETCYRRHVLAAGIGGELDYERLPSTSPANASWSFERKLGTWKKTIGAALGPA